MIDEVLREIAPTINQQRYIPVVRESIMTRLQTQFAERRQLLEGLSRQSQDKIRLQAEIDEAKKIIAAIQNEATCVRDLTTRVAQQEGQLQQQLRDNNELIRELDKYNNGDQMRHLNAQLNAAHAENHRLIVAARDLNERINVQANANVQHQKVEVDL